MGVAVTLTPTLRPTLPPIPNLCYLVLGGMLGGVLGGVSGGVFEQHPPQWMYRKQREFERLGLVLAIVTINVCNCYH